MAGRLSFVPFSGRAYSLGSEEAPPQAPTSPGRPLPTERPLPAPVEPAHTSCWTRFVECISNGATSICNQLTDLINRIRACCCCRMTFGEPFEDSRVEQRLFTYWIEPPHTRCSYTVTYRFIQ